METIAGVSSELPERLAVVIDGGRASKKIITDTEDEELPSSGGAVLSNDDLLLEILLRSPAISIFRWKIVSKRWLSLITTPTFALRRSQILNRDPPSGLFLRRDTRSSFEYDFVPLDIRIPASRSPTSINFTPGLAAGKVEILQSCNGLLLCCIRNPHVPDESIFVCNPSLNLMKMLPKQNDDLNIRHIRSDYTIGGIIMAFDPTKSPYYKVIRAAPIDSDGGFIQIQIYSSETCNWSDCGVRFREPRYFTGFSCGLYWNDSICWLRRLDHVSRLKLNVQRPVLTTIKPPKPLFCHCHNKLFESRGRLLHVFGAHDITLMIIYEMRNCEWWWMYSVDVDFLTEKRLLHFCVHFLTEKRLLHFCVRAIVLGETEEESFIMIETNGTIWKYNLLLKTHSHSDLLHTSLHRLPSLSSFDEFPFIASFAGV